MISQVPVRGSLHPERLRYRNKLLLPGYRWVRDAPFMCVQAAGEHRVPLSDHLMAAAPNGVSHMRYSWSLTSVGTPTIILAPFH